MLLFSGLRSTHILTAPDFFGAITIPAHQGVGVSTFDITSIVSVLSSSSLTLLCRGRGTLLGVNREKGFAPGSSWISYSSPRLPKPSKSSGNSSLIVVMVRGVCAVIELSRLLMRPRVCIAGRPSNFILRPETTNTCWGAGFSPLA